MISLVPIESIIDHYLIHIPNTTYQARSELLSLVVLGGEDDVVVELQLGLVVALQRLEVDDEVVLDSENRVGRQPRVVVGV